MGELSERVKLSLLVNGNGIPDNFKNNSLYFYDKYQKTSPDASYRGIITASLSLPSGTQVLVNTGGLLLVV